MELGARFCTIISVPHRSTMPYSSAPISLRINPNAAPLPNASSFRWTKLLTRIDAKVGRGGAKTTPSPDAEKKWTNIGVVTESLSNGMFRVGLVNLVEKKFVRVNDAAILGYVSGRIRTNHVRVVPGDTVKIEISPYDTKKGRIVYRLSRRDLERMTGARDDFEEDG